MRPDGDSLIHLISFWQSTLLKTFVTTSSDEPQSKTIKPSISFASKDRNAFRYFSTLCNHSISITCLRQLTWYLITWLETSKTAYLLITYTASLNSLFEFLLHFFHFLILSFLSSQSSVAERKLYVYYSTSVDRVQTVGCKRLIDSDGLKVFVKFC